MRRKCGILSTTVLIMNGLTSAILVAVVVGVADLVVIGVFGFVTVDTRTRVTGWMETAGATILSRLCALTGVLATRYDFETL